MGKVAADFETNKTYAVGDLCLYGGLLYVFTQAHSAGAWDDSDVNAVDSIPEHDIDRIIAGMDNADKAADFVDTVVFEPSLINGTRYKYVLTSAPDPRE